MDAWPHCCPSMSKHDRFCLLTGVASDVSAHRIPHTTCRVVLRERHPAHGAHLSPAWKRSSFLAGLWLGLPRPPPGPLVSRKLATRSGLPAAGRPSSSDCSSCWYAGLESCAHQRQGADDGTRPHTGCPSCTAGMVSKIQYSKGLDGWNMPGFTWCLPEPP